MPKFIRYNENFIGGYQCLDCDSRNEIEHSSQVMNFFGKVLKNIITDVNELKQNNLNSNENSVIEFQKIEDFQKNNVDLEIQSCEKIRDIIDVVCDIQSDIYKHQKGLDTDIFKLDLRRKFAHVEKIIRELIL